MARYSMLLALSKYLLSSSSSSLHSPPLVVRTPQRRNVKTNTVLSSSSSSSSSSSFISIVGLIITILLSSTTVVQGNSFTESLLFLDTNMQHGHSGTQQIKGEAIYASDIEFPSTTWAEGLLAIDIDIVDVSTVASYDNRFSMYALFPSLRISLIYNGSFVISSSSTTGTTENHRPTKEQIQAACVTVKTLFPWLALLPCHERQSIYDLHLGQGAITAKDILHRDGRLSLSTFYDVDTLKNIPYSTFNSSLPTDASLNSALKPSMLVWGGGLLPSTLTYEDKVLVSSLSSELPVCTPLSQCIPGLFFPSSTTRTVDASVTTNQHDYPLGPIATYLLSRRDAWVKGGMTNDNWVPLGLHISIAPSPSNIGKNNNETLLRIAIAETAAQKSLGMASPPVISYASTFATDSSYMIRINQSEVYIHNEDTCEHFVIPETLEMRTKKNLPIVPASAYGRGIATLCGIFSALHHTYGFVSPIKGLLRYPLDEPLSAIDKVTFQTTLEPNPVSPWNSKVCMFVQKNGLHHDITYRVTASTVFDEDEFIQQLYHYKNSSTMTTMVSRASGPALPLIRPTTRSTCHISLVQPVPQSLYFDLDEVREQVRGGSYGDAVEGAVFRSFARAIDVERPTSVSTQHSIIFSHAIHTPERFQHYNYDETEFPSSYRNDLGTNIFMNRKRFPYGGAFVTIEAFEEIMDATVKPPVTRPRVRLTINATFQQLLHARYQSSGCAKMSKADIATAETVTAGCTTMRDVLSSYGRPGVDGTLFIQPPTRAFVGWSPLKHSYPSTPGCYAFAHLPLPQVHLQCTEASVSKVRASSTTVYGTSVNTVDYSKKEIVKQNPLHVLEDHIAIHGTGLGEYLPVPAVNIPLEYRTGESSWDCTPPIPPVPVGLLEHHSFIPIGNAFFALTGAFILSAIAFRSKLRANETANTVANTSNLHDDGNHGEGTGLVVPQPQHPLHTPLVGQFNIGSVNQPLMSTGAHRTVTGSVPTASATTTPRRRR